MQDNLIIGVIGQSGSGKTTWVKNFIRNSDYQVYLLLDVTNQFPQFRSISDGTIYKYSKFQDADELMRVLKSLPRSMSKLIIFDDADLTLRGSDYEYVFLYHRNYNTDIVYTSKRLKGMNSKIQFQTKKLIIFKYSHRFIRDLIEFGFDREFAEKLTKLETFQFVEIDL